MKYIFDEYSSTKDRMEFKLAGTGQMITGIFFIIVTIAVVWGSFELVNRNIIPAEVKTSFIWLSLLPLAIAVNAFGEVKYPARLTFDNRNGELEILQKRSQSQDMAITLPYSMVQADLQNNQIILKILQDSQWVLYSGNDAKSHYDKIKECLDSSPQGTSKREYHPLFEVEKKPEETMIRWKKKKNLHLPMLLFVLGVLGGTISSPIELVAKVAIGIVFGLILLLLLFVYLGSVGVQQKLSITPEKIGFNCSGGFAQKSLSLEANEISKVIFDMNLETKQSNIMFFMGESHQKMIKAQEGDIGLGDILSMLPKGIDTGYLNACEKIFLGKAVQEAFESYQYPHVTQ